SHSHKSQFFTRQPVSSPTPKDQIIVSAPKSDHRKDHLSTNIHKQLPSRDPKDKENISRPPKLHPPTAQKKKNPEEEIPLDEGFKDF
ncbi:MAG: hypothetical protein NZL93_00270, partial [Chthoniobacterales bacterium]|nr:hypothetical protein [Chthoniobacterales bacterium]